MNSSSWFPIPAAFRLAVACAMTLSSSAADPGSIRYNRDIRPILSDNCFHCHGPDKKSRDSGLRLDVREDAIKPAKSGDTAIVPGNPSESQMLARLASDDPEEIMPPPKAHKILKPEQKDLLKRWIAEGAPYEAHWAYTPLARPALASTAGSPIDAFIQARLAEKNLKPAPEADRRTLIRRLSLDLIGLPPSPEAVDAFAKDQDPKSYEKLVDALLASPRYGEKMAQQWLDLARYADTVGFHGDQNQNVWAYRDWVIDAYNANKPFDAFTIEQLAGDLLPNATPRQRLATCFNRLNMVTREGGAQAKEYLVKYTADRIRTVANTWLGSTFGCAECHDHKFDPISQKDFYSLGAFFADVKQWGLYSDYTYTPNPDLRGWSNDHPFPPELVVESDALKRRMNALRVRMGTIVSEAQPPAEAYAAWRTRIAEYLAKHPSGFETPKAIVMVKAGKPEASQTADGRVLVDLKVGREIQLDLQPSTEWIGALKLELLPDPKNGNQILRGEKSGELEKPTFDLLKNDGTTEAIAIRHARADHAGARYVNGEELAGVESGWKIEPKDLALAHTAIYLPERPVQLKAGESVRITLPENRLANVRVSVSPLAPGAGTPSPKDLAATIGDPQKALELYLRSTAWDQKAFGELVRADADLIQCRGGRTPVLVTESSPTPLTIRVLKRGNWQDESGEICVPATPHFLPQLAASHEGPLTRLDLARWLVSTQNPLTPRVVMNRLWRQYFGTGLSAQVDDVGAQGETPSHPELLDWLGSEFRESGWDLKHMVKLVAMSQTYRQVAGLRRELRDSDPQNRLLASQNPRRLEAESVRDNALAIAGLLTLEMGGPASKPYQPEGYYADLQFPSRTYDPDADSAQWRRGVYMWWQRTALHPMLLNFDAPSREDCVALRSQANTPQQALTLLNDPTMVEAARVWAGQLLAAAPDDSGRLELAYRRALARAPRTEEKESLLKALAAAREEYRQRPNDAAQLVKIGFAPTDTNADAIELSDWTTVCRVLLNLHETITRY